MRREFFFAQKAFVVHENKVLVIRKSGEDPDHPGRWEVPGGRMEFGEDIDSHLSREVREEAGLEIVPGAPFHVWQWQMERIAPNGDPVRMQVVAVARMCYPVSLTVSTTGQVEEDYIADAHWALIDRLFDYEWIPNMMPVLRSFIAQLSLERSRI